MASFSGQPPSEVQHDLMRRKENCVNFLAALGPLIEPVLSVAALLSPARAGTAKGTTAAAAAVWYRTVPYLPYLLYLGILRAVFRIPTHWFQCGSGYFFVVFCSDV